MRIVKYKINSFTYLLSDQIGEVQYTYKWDQIDIEDINGLKGRYSSTPYCFQCTDAALFIH